MCVFSFDNPLLTVESLKKYLETATEDQCFALGSSLTNSSPDYPLKRMLIQNRINHITKDTKAFFPKCTCPYIVNEASCGNEDNPILLGSMCEEIQHGTFCESNPEYHSIS